MQSIWWCPGSQFPSVLLGLCAAANCSNLTSLSFSSPKSYFPTRFLKWSPLVMVSTFALRSPMTIKNSFLLTLVNFLFQIFIKFFSFCEVCWSWSSRQCILLHSKSNSDCSKLQPMHKPRRNFNNNFKINTKLRITKLKK